LSGLKDFVPTAIPEDDPAEEECHIVCGEAHDGGGVNEVRSVLSEDIGKVSVFLFIQIFCPCLCRFLLFLFLLCLLKLAKEKVLVSIIFLTKMFLLMFQVRSNQHVYLD